MARKLLHQCERCGQQATLERAQRLSDEDFYEVFGELMDAQAALKDLEQLYARLQLELMKANTQLEHARAAIRFDHAIQEASQAAEELEGRPF